MSNVPDDDLRDLYALYALGVLEEPERSQIEAALRSGSEEAQKNLRQAMENNALLTAAVPLAEPPARLRKRVMASVGVEPKSSFQWMWAWVAATAAALVGAVYLGNESQQRSSELAQVRVELQTALSQAASTNTELVRARSVLDFLNAAETKLVTFGPADPKPPKGRVLLNPGKGVVLIASNLPPAPAGKIYEMWIIPKRGSGKPIPAGLFQSTQGGTALHLQSVQVELDSAIAVTLEPEAGSPQPTTTPLFVAL